MKFSIDKKSKTVYLLDKETIDYCVKEKYLEKASDLSSVAVAFYEASTDEVIPDDDIENWTLGTNTVELLDHLKSVLVDSDKVDVVTINN